MYAIAECAYEDAFIEITLSSFLLQAQCWSYLTILKYVYFSFADFRSKSVKGDEQS